MNETFCIFFTSLKPKESSQIFSLFGIKSPTDSYMFSVTYTRTGNISIRPTVRAYGYMITQDEAKTLKTAGWGGLNPTAMIAVEEDHLPLMMKMIAVDGAPTHTFISSRLVPV